MRLQVDYLDNFDIHGINNDEQLNLTLMKGGVLETVRKAMSEVTLLGGGILPELEVACARSAP